MPFVGAPREDIALGIATGAWLAGGLGVVLLQNSGLGHLVNALTSLNLPYSIPVVLVIGWRGETSDDAVEHAIMGPLTVPMLDLAGIGHTILDQDVSAAAATTFQALNTRRPTALLVRAGGLTWS